MQFCTYAHYKPDNSIFYIGKGSHKRAYSPAGRNVVWNRIVKKHGEFKVEILAQWPTEQEAFEHEIFLIDTFQKMGYQLANIAKGGMGSTGFRHTNEHKANLSLQMKANNPMANVELREKQKMAVQSAMQRPDVKRKQSANRIGMKFSESHIESLKNCHPTKPCVINGVEYKSLMEASRQLGIRHGTLHRWLNRPEIKRGSKYAYLTEVRWL